MKKILFLIAIIVFTIITFITYNLYFINVTFLDHLITSDSSDYHHVYIGINQGVYGTVVGNSSYGLINNYGLQSKYVQPLDDGSTDGIDFSSKNRYYQIVQYREGIELDENAVESVYESKVNLGGTFFSIIDIIINNTLHLSQYEKMFSFHFLSSLAAIMVFILISYWCYKEFGLLSALFVLLSVIGSKYLAPYGSGLSNSAFVYFLPFTTSLIILNYEEKNNKKISWLLEFLFISSAIMIKLMMGYELFPTVMVSVTVMYFYYSIARKWDLKYFLKRFCRVTAAAFTGLVITLLVHFTQLSLYFKSSKLGLSYLTFTFGKRLWGNSANYAKSYEESLNASVSEVIFKLFRFTKSNGVVFHMNLYTLSIITVSIFIIVISLYAYYKKSNKITVSNSIIFRKLSALIICIVIAIVGSLSTLFILKSHSYIHGAYSSIVFYIPFTILLFSMIGYVIEQAVKESI